MSSPTDAARTLLRVAVRTFFPQSKQIFLFDALLTYNALNVDEMVSLFPPHMAQAKEVRALLNPLRTARMVSVGTKSELKLGATKSMQREYYYVNYHEAIDSLKYRMVKIAEKVADLYKIIEGQRKDWWCPRCGAEYDELSILDKVDPERGFYCERCKATLNQNEAAVRERGDHAKIRNLNDQLRPFNALLSVIDSGDVTENGFEDAHAHRREIPQDESLGAPQRSTYQQVANQRNQEQRKQQSVVDEKAVSISIMDEKEQEARDAALKKERMRTSALMNAMPEWHSGNAIKKEENAVKKEEEGASPMPVPAAAGIKREQEDVKPDLRTEDKKMNDELDDVYQQILREREEEERRRKAVEAEEEDDEFDDDDEEDEFEDAAPSGVGTPMSSAQPSLRMDVTPTKNRLNGNSLKRELDLDAESVSGTDTGANTPAEFTSAPKKIKLENGSAAAASVPSIAVNGAANDSDEDDDFEDV